MHGRKLACPGRARTAALLCTLLFTALPAAHAGTAGLLGGDFLSGFVDDLGHHVQGQYLQRPLRLVLFGYTSCPDVCPLTLAALHQALAGMGARASRIDPVFVTVDPDRDTVVRLHRYVSAFDPRIRGYRTDAAHLQQLAQQLQVRYWREATGPGPDDYGVDHTATLFLISRDGRILARIHHNPDPGVLSQAILNAVRAAGS
ncbi:MAG TPA: SCO family protein [Steroidobacteraceae bacterium]|nr:SCO family protein [Steroidobacteraceae bacterium]